MLGYSFGGFRVGVRGLGWGRLNQLGLIWEIGAGAW
jgi:hypothetical protein